MQLINVHSSTSASALSKALTAATCALLAPALNAAPTPGTWRFDTAIMYYGEDNSRVSAIEPVISATRYFENDKSFNAKLVIDTLTGASPSGATPSDNSITYTRPSGRGEYVVKAGEDPLDDSFKDQRTALSFSWSSPINRDWAYSTALYGSSEHDYQSLGLSGNLSRYFNQKNTQLTLGLSASNDTIKPEGGITLGLQPVPAPKANNFSSSRADDSDTKTLLDVLIGVTQVINKRTIMQFNYSISSSDGYLSDPYKILSIIDDSPGANYGKNAVDNTGYPLFIYEKRPDARLKHSLYWQTKYMLNSGDVVDGSYRFMTDDWGIQSHTVDLKYHWDFGTHYLEPHVRYYMQSEADFYERYLLNSDYTKTPDHSHLTEASADYRLGDLTGTAFGLKYGREINETRSYYVKAEYFIQTNDGDKGIGALQSQSLYPDTKAVMVTLGYSF